MTATYDGAAMTIFIDGAEVATKPLKGNIRNLPLAVCIGRNEQTCGQETSVFTCDAIIDNVGIFADAVKPGSFDPSKAALWLDFEEETQEGTFWTYGLGARTYGSIWPDRTPQPEMWQMKKSTQPLSFTLLDPEQGTVEVWNRSRFLNASHYTTSWTLTADADVVASGALPLDVAPMERKIVRIPLTHPEAVPGKEYRLTVSSALAKDEIWAPKGHEVSWDQFELTAWNVPAKPVPATGKVRLAQDGKGITASGEGRRERNAFRTAPAERLAGAARQRTGRLERRQRRPDRCQGVRHPRFRSGFGFPLPCGGAGPDVCDSHPGGGPGSRG